MTNLHLNQLSCQCRIGDWSLSHKYFHYDNTLCYLLIIATHSRSQATSYTFALSYILIANTLSISPTQWFTDYLSELCEDEHVHRYLDVRVFLTNINSPPDELASALLQLGLKTAGPQCVVRRPSQPQLNNLHSTTSYGVPDFTALLDCKSKTI